MPFATVVLPDPVPPAMPITSGDAFFCMIEIIHQRIINIV
jgi:hypothetical protein